MWAAPFPNKAILSHREQVGYITKLSSSMRTVNMAGLKECHLFNLTSGRVEGIWSLIGMRFLLENLAK